MLSSLEPSSIRRISGAVVDGVMSAWAARQGKRRWGEKTPKHDCCWPQISADFEGSPVIHVVRDGRDVALSMIEARFGPKSIYSCAKEWKEYLHQLEDIPGRMCRMRYSLRLPTRTSCEDTRRVLKATCDFLGERYAPEMLVYYRDTSPYPTDARNRQNLTKPVMVENKQKWRSRMTKDEVRVFEQSPATCLLGTC